MASITDYAIDDQASVSWDTPDLYYVGVDTPNPPDRRLAILHIPAATAALDFATLATARICTPAAVSLIAAASGGRKLQMQESFLHIPAATAALDYAIDARCPQNMHTYCSLTHRCSSRQP